MSSDNDIYRWYADVIVYRGFGPLIACLGIVGGTLSLLVFRRKSLKKKSCSIYFFYLALADLLSPTLRTLCFLCLAKGRIQMNILPKRFHQEYQLFSKSTLIRQRTTGETSG
ncbi:unnamed protein product [Rotaria sp. Silwood1]|nr:unnamed protein product [Rotaria sp. Silwood1]